jgi:nucleotide-binding universal stress UspA family protein
MTTESNSSDASIGTAVVGLDGSSGSRHALEWAVRNSAPHATLHLVHAVSPTLELAAGAVQIDSAGIVAERKRQLVEEWAAGVSDDDVNLVYHVLEDEPPAALAGLAAEVGAQVIVVGAHHQSKLGPRRIGSTIARLIDDPVTPIAVVPEHGDLVPAGSVVVGVGDDASMNSALGWAVAYASAHALALSLVRVSPTRPLFSIDGLVSMLAYYIDPGVLDTWALDDLAELAAEIRRSTDEEMTISWSAPKRPRGPRLVEESADAALLVIEVRSDPASPVPSWVHHAVRHAPCPIMLFPLPAGDQGDDGLGDGG